MPGHEVHRPTRRARLHPRPAAGTAATVGNRRPVAGPDGKRRAGSGRGRVAGGAGGGLAAGAGCRESAVPGSPGPPGARAGDRDRALEPVEQAGGGRPGIVSRQATRVAQEPGSPGRDRPAAGMDPHAPGGSARVRLFGDGQQGRKRRAAEFWPIRLRDPLPVIPIPLRTSDADARCPQQGPDQLGDLRRLDRIFAQRDIRLLGVDDPDLPGVAARQGLDPLRRRGRSGRRTRLSTWIRSSFQCRPGCGSRPRPAGSRPGGAGGRSGRSAPGGSRPGG